MDRMDVIDWMDVIIGPHPVYFVHPVVLAKIKKAKPGWT
jgi:hypothetical protein